MLRDPCPRLLKGLTAVLAVAAMAQIVFAHRAEEAMTAAPKRSLPVEARSLVIAQPMGAAQLPPPPTLKYTIPADPFRQLDRIGLDGHSLRHVALSLGIDIRPVAAMDLTGIDMDGIDASDRNCLTQAIYYEARNQDVAGQMAVADVVLNRVTSKRYPNSICDVVYQGAERETGCQFTFTCDGSLDRPVERRAMVRSQILATAILGGFRLPLSGNATNYHAGYVSPYWAPTLDETAKIGDHIFYKRGRNYNTYVRQQASLTSG